jgi:hypothetical protein
VLLHPEIAVDRDDETTVWSVGRVAHGRARRLRCGRLKQHGEESELRDH